MKFPTGAVVTAVASLAGLMSPSITFAAPLSRRPPNVVLVMFDDLNDWIQTLDRSAPIRTPNLDRLAARGVLFSQAHCASPACNPSRTAMLTGLSPATTGIYSNLANWKDVIPDAVTLPRYFREHGYYSAGSGKIFHNYLGFAFHDDRGFDEFKKHSYPFDAPYPSPKRNGLPQLGNENFDWGVWPLKEEDAVDHQTADYGINFLHHPHAKPFFLAIGFYRPHSPHFAPQQFADMYPLEKVRLPDVDPHDLDDLPPAALALLKPMAWRLPSLLAADHGGSRYWKDFVRFYEAGATYADSQLGRLLDALDASPDRENTIIVALSDNGFHLGEKSHFEKFVLWQKTTHVPLIIVAPGVTQPGQVCQRPISLLNLYPTLLELAGLPPKSDCDGVSLVPLLRDPGREWKLPAIMTYLRGNHAVRTERWRYICYADGSEELYDEQADPNEWKNLARDSAYVSVLAGLRPYVPSKNAPSVPDVKAGAAGRLALIADPTETDPTIDEARGDRVASLGGR